jgi:hypothetical protein
MGDKTLRKMELGDQYGEKSWQYCCELDRRDLLDRCMLDLSAESLFGESRPAHHSQSLANHRVHDWQLLALFVGDLSERPIRIPKLGLLFIVQALATRPSAMIVSQQFAPKDVSHRCSAYSLDIRAVGKVEQGPRGSSRGSVLSSHEQGDHHVRDIPIAESHSVPVFAAGQSRDHIIVML